MCVCVTIKYMAEQWEAIMGAPEKREVESRGLYCISVLGIGNMGEVGTFPYVVLADSLEDAVESGRQQGMAKYPGRQIHAVAVQVPEETIKSLQSK